MTLKKLFVIAAASALVIGGIITAAFLQPPSLRSAARRDWKQKSLAEISTQIVDPGWPSNELARLAFRRANNPDGAEGWLSDRIIVTRKGEWMAYANICRKEDRHTHDLFLARGSDGRWYYSTYHFCSGMIALSMDEQPADLRAFAEKYFVRTFDGKSDDCLDKTWPPDSR